MKVEQRASRCMSPEYRGKSIHPIPPLTPTKQEQSHLVNRKGKAHAASLPPPSSRESGLLLVRPPISRAEQALACAQPFMLAYPYPQVRAGHHALAETPCILLPGCCIQRILASVEMKIAPSVGKMPAKGSMIADVV